MQSLAKYEFDQQHQSGRMNLIIQETWMLKVELSDLGGDGWEISFY